MRRKKQVNLTSVNDMSDRKDLPHMEMAESMKGEKETNGFFNDIMSYQWRLFGMNLGTIKERWAAWCGLFIAVCLALGGGLAIQGNGSLARNWGTYGQHVEWRRDGFVRGDIIWKNSKGNCESSDGNHVGFANGDCTAADLSKTNATFDMLGGNQDNMVKVSTYPVAHICAVRRIEGEPLRKVTESWNCTSGKSNANENTR